ncbi:MAG: hypothetical protein ACREEH_08215, partial [Caulobacteraceae bacterium]
MAERDALVGRIAAAFPELAFSNADLIESGDDHQIVLLDGEWVFRFPRTVERERLFRVELGVLSALRGRILAALPDYRFLPPSRDFGGYPLIEGEPLDCARFAFDE